MSANPTSTSLSGDAILVLRHSDLPAEHAGEHENGWSVLVGERLAAAATSAS